MCVTVPARVISIEGKAAEVDIYGMRRHVYLAVEHVAIDNWVLVYGNVALTVLDSKTAQETLELLAEIAKD